MLRIVRQCAVAEPMERATLQVVEKVVVRPEVHVPLPNPAGPADDHPHQGCPSGTEFRSLRLVPVHPLRRGGRAPDRPTGLMNFGQ